MTTQLPRPVPSPSFLAVRLQREWDALSHRPAVVQRAQRWGLGVSFTSLDQLVAATGYRAAAGAPRGNRPDGDRPDGNQPGADVPSAPAVTAALLRAARTDDLAARVVLQRLLPGLFSIARRWQRRQGADTDAFADVVAAAWVVVREYPLERRPHHLVANLLRDAEYHAFVRPRRRTVVHVPVPNDVLDHPVAEAEADARRQLAEVVACTQSLTDHERKLLALLLKGSSTVDIAAALHVSERTVRAHRETMVYRMRQAVAA